MTFDVALLCLSVPLILLALVGKVEAQFFKVEPIGLWGRLAAGTLGVLFMVIAFVLCFRSSPDLKKGKEDRNVIYEYMTDQVRSREKVIAELQTDNWLLRAKL